MNSRGLRFFLKLAGWGAVIGLLVVLLLAVGTYVAYRNAGKVVDWVLQESEAPVRVSIGETNIDPVKATVRVDGLSVFASPDADAPLLKIGSISAHAPLDRAVGGRVEKLHLDRAEIRVNQKDLDHLIGPEKPGEKPSSNPGGGAFAIGDLKIEGGRIEVDLDSLPPMRGRFRYEGREFRATPGPVEEGSEQRVELFDVEVGDTDRNAFDPPVLRLPHVRVAFVPGDGYLSGRISSAEIRGPRILVTPATVGGLMADFWPSEATHEVAESSGPPTRWDVEKVLVEDGRFEMRGFRIGKIRFPDVSFEFSLGLGGWTTDPGAAPPDSSQRIRLTNLRVGGSPGEGTPEVKPLLRLESLEARLRPLDFAREGLIDSLKVESPVLRASPSSFRDLLAMSIPGTPAPEAPDSPSSAEGEAANGVGRFFKVADLELTGGQLSWMDFGPSVPEGRAEFTVTTRGEIPVSADGGSSTVDFGYRLRIERPVAVHPDFPGEPVVQARAIEADFSARGLQQSRFIESVRLDGFHLTHGSGLDALMAAGPESASPDAPKAADKPQAEGGHPVTPTPNPATPPDKDLSALWMLGELKMVNDGLITIKELAPQVPEFTFTFRGDRRKPLENIPLTMDSGLVDAYVRQGRVVGAEIFSPFREVHKFEVAELSLRSPLRPLTTVADLQTIFLEFTFEGLLKNRIDRIQIVSPKLYIGEHFFWFVDYYRRLAEGGEADGAEGKKDVAGEADVADAGAAGNADSPDSGTGSDGWTVEEVELAFGHLFVAPHGEVWNLPVLPFSCRVEVPSGKIDLELDIPRDTYTLEKIKLELEGLVGHVFFNLPLKQKDNNLVETLKAAKVRFRGYEADEVHLTVTYDQNGIYGQFGGEAYEGYVNGGFNLYFDDNYSWDAWVAGTKVNMKPLSHVLSPGSFLMSGVVSLTVEAKGDEDVLKSAKADLNAVAPGLIDVEALGPVIDELPVDWGNLERGLTAAGLHALKEFHYESAVGRLRLEEVGFASLMGRGNLVLDLNGPLGRRLIEVNLLEGEGSEPDSGSTQSVEIEPLAGNRRIEP